jgi:hypothetical protein
LLVCFHNRDASRYQLTIETVLDPPSALRPGITRGRRDPTEASSHRNWLSESVRVHAQADDRLLNRRHARFVPSDRCTAHLPLLSASRRANGNPRASILQVVATKAMGLGGNRTHRPLERDQALAERQLLVYACCVSGLLYHSLTMAGACSASSSFDMRSG